MSDRCDTLTSPAVSIPQSDSISVSQSRSSVQIGGCIWVYKGVKNNTFFILGMKYRLRQNKNPSIYAFQKSKIFFVRVTPRFTALASTSENRKNTVLKEEETTY